MDESVDKEPSSRNTSERFAYVTLVTSDVYVDGALVLLHSLRRTLTPHSILCLVTPVTLSHDSLHRLQQHFDGVIETDLHESYDTCNLALLGRPDLRSTLTKIQLWHPALFGAWSAICYLDADTLVRQSIDDVFSRFYDWRSDESAWEQGGLVAAAPDTGWPDCFNSGVLLLAPGLECYHALQRRTAQSNASFDGADQGLLNEHFADWSRTKPYRRLPFLYNATANVYYTYEPALQRFGHDVRVVHFIGISKPWHWERTASGQLQSSPSTSERWCQLVNLWWNIHDEHVSGWKHWRGPFVKEKAFGQGYHHITEPIKSEQPEPQRYSDDTNRIVDNQLLSSEEYTQEVADWDKDWSWANDRVHPLDYTYLTSHTKIIEPSTKLNMPEARSRDHLLHKQWQQSEEQTDAITDATSQSNFSHTTNISPSISQKQHQTSNEHFNATSEPQMSSPDFDGTKSPKHPAWIQSQRPWEDVAREGWMHSDEFQPHSYDQAYTRRHIDTPRYDKPQIERQPHRSLHSSESRHDWQTEYSPMPIPSNRPIYEAQQVVLQPRFEQHTTHNHQYEQHNKETDHHDHGQISTSPNHHHRTLEHDSYFWPHSGDDGNPSYRQNVADERDTLSRSSGSPIYYPQPKSPMVVNPVALWESSEEQARRRAWAHQVTAPIENELKSHESYHNASQTASMPSADAGIPLSAMDHIDSSSLPQETPWKISHVRQRPTEATDMNNDIVPGHLGMQFKEGVANDASARDAAGQLLKRWNEAVVARNIQTRFGNIDPHQLSHSVVSPEKGTDAIRLETTVSCEAEDSKGERTVYRFTLSSTLDIGGAKTSPVATAPVWAPEKHTQPNLAALANGRQDGVPIADIARYDQPEPFPTKPSKITDNASVPTVLNLMQNDMEQKTDNRYYDYNNIVSLPQPKNYQEPAISRRSSFVQLQRNAARAPYMALQSGYDNADQFAESDARYWKLQRQLIDLEMSQQQHENKSTNDNELVALAVNTSAGREMIQDQNKLDLASPPTPSLAPTLSYQPEPGGLLRRRPSAFSIADPASFTLDNKQIDSLPSAPAEIPSKKPTQLSRRRSQSSPRLMEGSVRLNNSGKLKVDDTQARFKRSRSQSTLRRIATENSTQAKMKLAKPQEKPESTARPMFTTASSDSSESEESLDSGVDSDEESFRPTYGRMPTPFPRHLRRSAAANKQADVAQIKADEHGDKDSARSRSSSAGFGSTNFGLPIDISGRENSPGKAKFDSKLKWGDEDEDLIPPDTDRSLEAQWRRIIYGAPPPRTHVAAAVHKIPLNQPESSKANPVAKLPDFANDKEGAEGAHVSSCRIDKLPSAEIGSLENCDVDSTGIDETELGIVETNQPDTLQPPIQGQPEPKAFSKNPGSNVRAPPRKLHSTKSFLNMGSQEFETLSDAEEDSSEVEMQQRFWERAIKPSKSGMSTPYSPGRRKSLTEMSSMISPKDLEEWMRWQGDNNGTLSRDISNDILDESGEGKMQQQGSQELITPPVSKSKTSLDAIPSVDKADVIKELASSQDESTDDGDSMLFMTLSNPSHNLSLSPATELGSAHSRTEKHPKS